MDYLFKNGCMVIAWYGNYFFCLNSIDLEAAAAVQAKGILDAFEIAKVLSNDDTIEAKLR